jgi:hypothetical protein
VLAAGQLAVFDLTDQQFGCTLPRRWGGRRADAVLAHPGERDCRDHERLAQHSEAHLLIGKANMACLVCGVTDLFLAEEGFDAVGLVLAAA